MKLTVKYKPSKTLTNEIKNRSNAGANAGANKFYNIEVREEVMPMMSGGLSGKRARTYEYGTDIGKKAGTRIELVKKEHRGEVITASEVPGQVERLFYGYSKIHTSSTGHPDVNLGNPSYQERYKRKPKTNDNAQSEWTEVIMTSVQFRNEILNAVAAAFKDGGNKNG